MDINQFQDALERIKSITKRIPASEWTPEFREIANIAHLTLRDHAHVEAHCCVFCGQFVVGDIPIVCSRCVDERR